MHLYWLKVHKSVVEKDKPVNGLAEGLLKWTTETHYQRILLWIMKIHRRSCENVLFKVDCIKKDITEEQLKRQPTSLAEEIKTKTLLPFLSTLKTATGLELYSQMKHKYYFKKKVFSMKENWWKVETTLPWNLQPKGPQIPQLSVIFMGCINSYSVGSLTHS